MSQFSQIFKPFIPPIRPLQLQGSNTRFTIVTSLTLLLLQDSESLQGLHKTIVVKVFYFMQLLSFLIRLWWTILSLSFYLSHSIFPILSFSFYLSHCIFLILSFSFYLSHSCIITADDLDVQVEVAPGIRFPLQRVSLLPNGPPQVLLLDLLLEFFR